MVCKRVLRAALTVVAVLSMAYSSPAEQAAPATYAVVVSKAAYADAGWKAVVDALVEKYKAKVIVYDSSVADTLLQLRRLFPRYTCFVTPPADAGRQFVADVHRLVTKFDDDPYADTFWGILTGYDAANALRIARQAKPLIVRKVASGTEVALEMCIEGLWYCELVQSKLVRKVAGGEPAREKGPPDTTQALVAVLNDYKPDLFVTSGHATGRDWQIGYRYRNGAFRSKAGQLTGHDTAGKTYPVKSPNPKVYLPIGNCLMGYIDGPDAMALAWMNSAGVCQMIGYTVPTWFGYAGWGCLDTFVEQPGRYTFAEGFLANHHALVHCLATKYPELATLEPKPGQRPQLSARPAAAAPAPRTDMTGLGLLHDRDVVAFYGDPGWPARMADMPKAYDQTLTIKDGLHTLTILPRRGEKSFDPINVNGSQRGGRPIVQFLPGRIRNVRLVEGEDLKPLVTDDFILVPNPLKCDPARTYRVSFRAEPMR
jgi:hypothetical protein